MDDVPSILKVRDEVVVENDTPCRRCSYNLRGLKQNGRCPECGTRVGVSTLGELLHFSDPSWLGRMSWGFALMAVHAMVVVAGYLVPFVVYLGPWRGWILQASSLMGICGGWFATMRDPSGLGEAQYGKVRTFVRIALGVAVAWRGFALIASVIVPDSIYYHAYVGYAIVAAAGDFAMFLYLGRLSKRIPKPSLAIWSKFLQWTAPPLAAAWALIWLVLFTSSGGPNVSGISSWYLLISPFQFILYIVTFFFFIRFLRIFRKQLVLAREFWDSMDETRTSSGS